MNDQTRRRRRVAQRFDAPPNGSEAPPVTTIEERKLEVPRDELRQDMRQEQREETDRERADRMTAEILSREEVAGDFIDRFPLPMGGAPDGWHYEWKRKSVLGWEDPSYAINLATNGWRPVPAERHPEFMPVGGAHLAIEREGQILMEIPTAVMKRRQDNAYHTARNQIRLKQEQMQQPGPGQFARDNKGNSMVSIKRSYEPLTIPGNNDPK